MTLHGVFTIVKPKGFTSADAVRKIKRVLVNHTNNKSIKVGHGGTLDPFATGVLTIGVGNGCKSLTGLLHGSKEYIVKAKLGISTDTMDCEGKQTSTASFEHIDTELLNKVIQSKTGKIMQTPPVYSALKVNGVRAYSLARGGVAVELEPRQITIFEMKLLNFALPYFTLKIVCGGGTYVRKLVHDMALEMNSAAHADELERTRQGPFLLSDALPESEWNAVQILEAIRKSKKAHEEHLKKKKEL